MSSIDSVYRPILLSHILIGDLGIIFSNKDPPFLKFILCNALIILNTLFHAYLTIVQAQKMLSLTEKTENISPMVLCIELWSVVALILHIGHKSRFQRVIEGLKDIDRQLNKFNIHVDYHQQTKFSSIVTGIVLILITLEPIGAYLFGSNHDGGGKISLVALFSWIGSNWTLCSVFVSTYLSAKVITRHFKVLNVGLESRFRREQTRFQQWLTMDSRRTRVADEVDGVCLIGIIHQKIVVVAKELNHCFAMQIMTFVLPLLITGQLVLFAIYQNTYMRHPFPQTFFSDVLWTWKNSLFYVIIVAGFSLASAEGGRTLSVVHRIILHLKDEALATQFIYLSRQLQQSKIRFSCGLFRLDWSFFKMVLTASISYLIIRIQFH